MKYLLLISLVWSQTLWAADGAVSGGGGGTTNPNPVSQEKIIKVIQGESAMVLISWLNYQEYFFKFNSEANKLKSPFYKIFNSSKDFRSVVSNLNIELKTKEPCYDDSGNPKDGSIYTSFNSANAICISAFNLTPKLNEFDYDIQTLGLITHEVSHLFGTTENEATLIQEQIIKELVKTSFASVGSNLRLKYADEYAYWEDGVLTQLINQVELLEAKSSRPTADEMIDLNNSWITIKVRFFDSYLLFITNNISNLIDANVANIQNIEYYVDIKDMNTPQDVKDRYIKNMDACYSQSNEITAGMFGDCMESFSGGLSAEYDAVKVKKISTDEDMKNEFAKLHDFLLQIKQKLQDLNATKFQTVIN